MSISSLATGTSPLKQLVNIRGGDNSLNKTSVMLLTTLPWIG